ncbi:MAG TPA: S-layer homology domain-containing protein [Syntrophomonadaceae bacterium]|nr:S-layer homology domain-containing protein [Syntrophomonadaceae bacterium]
MIKQHKSVALLLVLFMVFTLVPVIPLPMAEAASGGTAMEELGFNTNIMPEGYEEPAGIDDTPYGKSNVIITPVSELFTVHAEEPGVNVIGTLKGHNDNSFESPITNTFPNLRERAYLATRTAPGDFDANGTDESVAMVAYAMTMGENPEHFDLVIIDPVTGENQTIVLQSGSTGIDISEEEMTSANQDYRDYALAYKMQNYLSVTAGDFDGDERDEIAVLVPAAKSAGGPTVAVYDYNGASWSKVNSFPLICWDDAIVNMVDLLAADINADGIEDLCYSQNLYDRKLEKWYQPTGNFNISHSYIQVRYGTKTGSPIYETIQCKRSDNEESIITRLALDFGDIDHDGRSELVAAGQIERDENTRWLAMYKYNHNTGNLQLVNDTSITVDDGNYKDEDGVNYPYNSLSTAGCITNLTCVKTVGGKEDIYCDSVLYEYTSSGFSIKKRFEGGTLTNGDFANQAAGSWWGAAGVEWTDIKSDGGLFYYHEWNATAADFDGDGIETVYLEQFFWKDQYVQYLNDYTINEKNGDSLVLHNPYYRLTEIDPLTLSGSEKAYTDDINIFMHDPNLQVNCNYLGTNYINFSFTAPNTDNDSILLKYKDYYFTYSSPIVMAVLASPPYFSDLKHLDGGDTYVYNSETSFGKTEGGGTTTTQTNTVSVGGMVGFEHEFSIFDVKVASIEIEAEFEHEWTWETEQADSTDYSVTYTTFGGQDSVVLYSIPTDVFIYDAWTPNEDGSGWSMSEMEVRLPYQPVTSVVEASAYDKIAAQYPEILPVVGGAILKHTLGQPATYPQTTGGLTGCLTGSEWSGVSGGSGAAITQGIDITSENTEKVAYNNEWKLTIGGSLFDVKANVSAGGEAGGGESTTNTNGTSFETTVVNMPQEGQDAGYGYNWKLLKYDYQGIQNFPVITYLVNDVRQPAALPASIDGKGISTSEIQLNWQDSKTTAGEINENVSYYSLYRYFDTSIYPGYREIARIPSISSGNYTYDESTGKYTASVGKHVFTYDEAANTYGYIDKNLSAYTKYQYKMTVTSNLLPYNSVYSDVCEARTLSDLATVSINGPSDITAYPDDSYVEFSVEVETILKPGYLLGGTPYYQWQKREKASRNQDGTWNVPEWTNIYGANETTLKIMSPDESDALEYRFMADIPITPQSGGGSQWIGAISNPASLNFAKRTPELSFSAVNTGEGSANFRLEGMVDKLEGKAVPTGTVAFTITNDGSFRRTVSAVVDSTGHVVTEDITLSEEGVYQISGVYSGDTVYDSAEAVIEHIAVFSTTTDLYYIVMENNVEYGASVTPVLRKYGQAGEIPGAAYTVKDTTGWLEGSTLTAKAVGTYMLTADFTVGSEAKTVSKRFQVIPKKITVYAPTDAAEQVSAVLPGSDTLVFEPELVLGDTAESLGLSVGCLDGEGHSVTISPATPPGVYKTVVVTDPAKSAAQSNYDFHFIDGSYTVLGTRYAVNLSKEGNGTLKVTIPALPAETVDGIDKYIEGTTLTVTASPVIGYRVCQWEVNGEVIDPETLPNPNVISRKIAGADLNIKAVFGLKNNSLTLVAEHGKITNDTYIQSGDIIAADAEINFTADADDGWHFEEWCLTQPGAVTIFAANPLKFTMPDDSCTLTAVFARDSYSLTLGEHLVAEAGGTVVSSGDLIKGDTLVNVSAASGYSVKKWFVDGSEDSTIPVPETYSFTMQNDTEINAETEVLSFTVNYDLVGEGSITATADGVAFASGDLVSGGSEIIITVDPGELYTFKTWEVDGDNACMISGKVLVCSALGEDLSVTAVLWDPVAITVTAGDNGSVEAEINGETAGISGDTLLVPYGADVTFIADPDSGYMVESWDTDGKSSYTTSKSWPLTNVTEDMIVHVSFTSIAFYNVYYMIAAGSEEYGSLEAEADENSFTSGEELGGGSELIFTAKPDQGYMASGWKVFIRGEEQEEYSDTVGNVLVIPGLSGETTVEVSFIKAILYIITLDDPENGSITGVYTPDDYDDAETDDHEVCEGTRSEFTVTPDQGYYVASVSINGTQLSEEDCTVNPDGSWTYIVESVEEDISVSADIRPLGTYTVTLIQSSGGIISAGSESAIPGEQVLIQAAPQNNYTFKAWNITAAEGGIDITIGEISAVSTYFIMPYSNVTVRAEFDYAGGGGGSGGGGGGGVVTPTVNVPTINASSDSTTVKVPYTMKGKTASIVLEDEIMEELLLASEKTYITIDMSGIEDCTGFGFDVEGKWLEKDGKILGIKIVGLGTVIISGEMLNTFGVNEENTVHVEITLGSMAISLAIDGKEIKDYDLFHPLRALYPFDGAMSDATIVYDKKTGKIMPFSMKDGKGNMKFNAAYFSVFDARDNVVKFNDIDEHWAADYITFTTARELFYGTGDGEFSPDISMTRAMFVTVLGRMFGVNISNYGGSDFADVAVGQWYSPYVQWAADNDIIAGYGDGSFGPDDPVTREQMAAILLRFADYANIKLQNESAKSQFRDSDAVSSWAAEDVMQARQTGLITGREDGNFDPQGTATRAEVSTILKQFIENVLSW